MIYDPDARCERWEQFVPEIMQEDIEKAKFFQKNLGYSLTGDTSQEGFTIFYGDKSRNGKGTCCETMLYIMGDYGRTAQPETIAQKRYSNSGSPSEDIARLKGARFVNMSEPDRGLLLNAALVKQLTGGDTVTARFLQQNSFEYKPEYKLFINTNHLPRITDDSVFASGRVKLIPFERHFSENEQDKGLKEFFRQPENMAGIFNWLLEGLKLMRVEGLKQPQSIIDAIEQYRKVSDTVGMFIEEALVEAIGSKMLIINVYPQFKKWSEKNGYGVLSNRNFISELKRKGFKVDNSTGNKVHLFDYEFSKDYDLFHEINPYKHFSDITSFAVRN